MIKALEADFNERGVEDAHVSQENLRFLSIMEEGIRIKQDGHCKKPLTFKEGRLNLPDNRKCAEHRLKCLKRRFRKDKQYHKDYAALMSKTISCGDAVKVSREDTLTLLGISHTTECTIHRNQGRYASPVRLFSEVWRRVIERLSAYRTRDDGQFDWCPLPISQRSSSSDARHWMHVPSNSCQNRRPRLFEISVVGWWKSLVPAISLLYESPPVWGRFITRLRKLRPQAQWSSRTRLFH